MMRLILLHCDGTNWQDFGGSGSATPSGAVMAFDLATCPTGWSEYTLARGRFIRGIDSTGSVDPDGVRAKGSLQNDELKSHTHRMRLNIGSYTITSGYAPPGSPYMQVSNDINKPFQQGTNQQIENTGGAETRPKNVALLYCRKD